MRRFSIRTAWPEEENALTRALRDRGAAGQPTLDLTASNPTRVGLAYESDLLAPLSDVRALAYEPEALGLASAREAVTAFYAARGVEVAPAHVAITASTSEAYAFLFQVLADPGDEILVPAPSYPLFGYLADLAGVRLVPYPLRYDGAWHVDLPALAGAISPRARAILVVSPNNPTGSYLTRAELVRLRAIAETHALALVSDEVFADYPLRPERADAPRAPSLAGETTGLAFALSGLSKVAGLPQLKLGWMVAAGDAALVEAALARVAMVADTYLSVGTPVQRALPALLARAPTLAARIAERTRANLELVRTALAAPCAASVLDVEGGWYATLRLPRTRSEQEWALALLDRGVLVHPGHFFDFEEEAYVVVSLLPRADDMARGLAVLRELVDAS